MKAPRQQPRKNSVPKAPKREPLVVEFLFPEPVAEETSPAAANSTAPAVQNDSRPKSERVVFRF
jgi:hypothetical protein